MISIQIFISFLFGLAAGSFANVCIFRMPRDLSVVRPRSRCPVCGTMIAGYDNIPLISFLLLRGRCRECSAAISWQYPLVELLTGTLFALIAYVFGLQPISPLFMYVVFVMIVVSGIDIACQIIPDTFSLSLIVVGIGFSWWNPLLGAVPAWSRVLQSGAGALTGAGVLLLLGALGSYLFKKEAMGMGDVKLLAGIGTVIGWEKVFSTLFIASVFGALVGGYLIATKRIERRGYIPFGPYLAAAGFLNLFLPLPRYILDALYGG